jgi:cob(I)alamin adenosyltransferase
MLLIIGLSLSFIAIGILYYLNNELKKKLKNNNRALLALQKEFTQYQVDESRVKEKDIAKMEIRHDNIAKSIKKNEDAIYGINKTLPEKIRNVIGHIEFAKPINKNTNI